MQVEEEVAVVLVVENKSIWSPISRSVLPVSVASYTVTVGGGGARTPTGNGVAGTDSYFGPPVTPDGITATGGVPVEWNLFLLVLLTMVVLVVLVIVQEHHILVRKYSTNISSTRK